MVNVTPSIVTYIIIFGIGLIIFLSIAYYFYRWIFSIKRQLWNQKQQINLLLKIAEKLGVDMQDSDILTIKYNNNNKDDSALK